MLQRVEEKRKSFDVGAIGNGKELRGTAVDISGSILWGATEIYNSMKGEVKATFFRDVGLCKCMDITKSEVKRLAALSKLQFSDEEINDLIPELEKIINFASEVNDSEELSGGKDNTEFVCWDNLREDSVKESLSNERVFQENRSENGFFVVRKVLG